MKTIVIPQFYRGPSGQRGLYNRQEVGLARAFAALGCRAVVLYPEPGAKAPRIETPEPNVKICYMPAAAFGVQAFYKSWQILLDEQADAVHVMGDNSLGVPGLYRFCQKHGILFYSQLGALKSTSDNAIVRRVMDLLLGRNLAVYRKTPTYAKTPAVAAELEGLGVPCAGLMPVGLDTAIIPAVPGSKAEIRRALKIDEQARVLAFVGRLDAYKQPLDLVPLLQAAPDWYAVIIGQGALSGELTRQLEEAGLAPRCRLIAQLPNEQVHKPYRLYEVKMKRTRIGCVLMAAGNSTRFGGNKLLTDFFGKTLIERAMEAIPRDKLCRAAVVSQYDEVLSMALDFDFLTVRNDRPEDGVSRTIRLGLDALGDVDAAMFMVADQPCLSRWSTEGLVSFYLKEPDKIAAMAYGARRGNPVIFPKDMFIELRDLTGDTGGSAVICKNQDKLRLYQVEDELELFDADRAAELERLKREKERTI